MDGTLSHKVEHLRFNDQPSSLASTITSSFDIHTLNNDLDMFKKMSMQQNDNFKRLNLSSSQSSTHGLNSEALNSALMNSDLIIASSRSTSTKISSEMGGSTLTGSQATNSNKFIDQQVYSNGFANENESNSSKEFRSKNMSHLSNIKEQSTFSNQMFNEASHHFIKSNSEFSMNSNRSKFQQSISVDSQDLSARTRNAYHNGIFLCFDFCS